MRLQEPAHEGLLRALAQIERQKNGKRLNRYPAGNQHGPSSKGIPSVKTGRPTPGRVKLLVLMSVRYVWLT